MKHIMVPVDGSGNALKALDVAIDLAERHRADLTLVNIMPSTEIPDEIRHFAEVEHVPQGPHWLYGRAVADNILAAANARIGNRKLGPIKVIVEGGEPWKVICNLARQHAVDTIVMGSRGLSEITGLVLGSVSHRVAHAAPCTVITVT